MKKKLFISVMCVINVLLFISIGIEVANVSHEQAALEGMTQLVYRSISYVDYLMAGAWLLMLVAIVRAHRDLFMASSWGYLGLYVCDIIISHHMALEANDPFFTLGALALLSIQVWVMWLAKGHINAQLA